MSDDESKGAGAAAGTDSQAYIKFKEALKAKGKDVNKFQLLSNEAFEKLMNKYGVDVDDQGDVIDDFRKHFPLPTNTAGNEAQVLKQLALLQRQLDSVAKRQRDSDNSKTSQPIHEKGEIAEETCSDQASSLSSISSVESSSTDEEADIVMTDQRFKRRLASGVSGSVYVFDDGQQKCVAKVFRHGIVFEKELKLLQQLQGKGPRFPRLLGSWDQPFPCILLQKYQRYLPLRTEEDIDKAGLHILAALRDLHSMGWCHCDVKPDNILYDKTLDGFVLADFSNATPTGVEVMYGPNRFVPPRIRGSYAPASAVNDFESLFQVHTEWCSRGAAESPKRHKRQN